MKTELKRVLAAAGAAFITLLSIPVGAASADNLEGASDVLTDGTFTFEMTDGGYIVTGCDPTTILKEFPEIRNGYPIVAIGDYAFNGCENITEIEIPRTVKYIGTNAFSGCTSLVRISFPDGITNVPDGSFLGCENLQEVDLPDSVATIGDYAFCYCSRLESFRLPASVSYIGSSAFSECSSLNNIDTSSNSAFVYEDGYLLNSSKDTIYRASSALNGSVYLPTGVSEISAGAFSGLVGIQKLYIQQGASKIGDYAFRDCISLTDIDLPNGVTEIGTGSFMYCVALETVELPVSLERLGTAAFMGCSSLRRAMLQNGLSSVGDNAFLGCTQLSSVSVPSSVSEIGEKAFGYTLGSSGDAVLQSGFSMSVYSGSAAEKYAKSNNITYTTADKSIKRTAFIIIAVGLLLAAAVFAVVLMARSRKGAPLSVRKAKKLEKERADEQSYEKIVGDEKEAGKAPDEDKDKTE